MKVNFNYIVDFQKIENFMMFHDILQNPINTRINNQNLFRRNALFIGISEHRRVVA